MEHKLIFFYFLKIYQNLPSSQSVNEPDGTIIFTALGTLVLLLILSIIFYKNTNKKNSTPSFIFKKAISVNILHSRGKGEFKLIIRNKSKEFIEIIAPEIILKGLFSEKKMKARSNTYPLTISPGSSHSIIFKKKQLLGGAKKKTSLKLFRVFIFDRNKNVIKSRYRFL